MVCYHHGNMVWWYDDGEHDHGVCDGDDDDF